MSNKCPVCKNTVTKKDEVYCNTKACSEFNIRYLPYEFNKMVRDLKEMERLRFVYVI